MRNKDDRNKMFRDAGILFAITLLAGLVLGFLHELTKEPIAHQQALKIQRACEEVFTGAASFEEMEAPGEKAMENSVTIGAVYRAVSADGSLLGYVINVTSAEGYGGNIELMMGVSLEGTLNGISLLKISETPGLGMRAEEVLVPQFAGKTASSYTYTKTGAVSEDQIDAISGATITTEAVTNAVNEGLRYVQINLTEGGNGQ